MKKTIFLMLILLVGGFYNASAQKTVSKGGATVTETTPIKPFYDAKLKIVTHVKAGANVLHGALDYVKFNANGTYEQSFTGTVKTGTWKYTMTGNTVAVTIGTNTTTYNLNVTGDTRMGLTTSTEELVLSKQ